MSERMPVLSAAMAVALSARCDQLTAHAVEDLRVKAEELLAKGDGLRTAIIAFATAYEAERRDKVAMAALGVALQAALDLALPPEAASAPAASAPAASAPAASAPADRVAAARARVTAAAAAPGHHDWMDRKDVNG